MATEMQKHMARWFGVKYLDAEELFYIPGSFEAIVLKLARRTMIEALGLASYKPCQNCHIKKGKPYVFVCAKILTMDRTAETYGDFRGYAVYLCIDCVNDHARKSEKRQRIFQSIGILTLALALGTASIFLMGKTRIILTVIAGITAIIGAGWPFTPSSHDIADYNGTYMAIQLLRTQLRDEGYRVFCDPDRSRIAGIGF